MEFTEDQIRYMARQEAEDVIKKTLRYALRAFEPVGSAKEEELPVATTKVELSREKETEQLELIENVQQLLNNFPAELHALMQVDSVGKIWYIKPVGFLPRETFTKIDGIIRNLDGKYVPASKAGKGQQHWELPK